MTRGNRVEELEKRVKELQASVSGLTDELIETKERVKALEEEVEPEDLLDRKLTRKTEAEDASEAPKGQESEDVDNTDEESTKTDDIIVA
ncbi:MULTISPECIES: bZIP transcription factor [unclassified Haladaptatus]|uniref:DUF7518 family protein n=1 Tax=unclassified Haladaptatus TaxID=2622732 RepID=UPI0023E786CB|nr:MULTISPECIES: bZIP transcription factor [unclassified Haladaptatus]